MFGTELTLVLDDDSATVLFDSLTWSMNATERSMMTNTSPKLRDKWATLDDLLAQLQVAKREALLGVDA